MDIDAKCLILCIGVFTSFACSENCFQGLRRPSVKSSPRVSAGICVLPGKKRVTINWSFKDLLKGDQVVCSSQLCKGKPRKEDRQ